MRVSAVDVTRPAKSGQAESASSYVRPVIDMSISAPGNFYLYLVYRLNLCDINSQASFFVYFYLQYALIKY